MHRSIQSRPPRLAGSGFHSFRKLTSALVRVGSTCFAHGYLVHTAMPNINPGTIRLGLFSRWHHADMRTVRKDMPRDLWKYWEGEAVRRALDGAKL